MKYKEHFIANIKVAAKCLVLMVFHFVHAWIPLKITSHEYWRIGQRLTQEQMEVLETIRKDPDEATGYDVQCMASLLLHLPMPERDDT